MDKSGMIFCCPYCHGSLNIDGNIYICNFCNLDYKYEHNIYYFFNKNADHWQKIQRINKPFTNETDDDQKDYTHFSPVGEFPYLPEESFSGCNERDRLAMQANGAMLNYVFDSIRGNLVNGDNLPLLNIGASRCWESYFFARYKPVIALNVNEHVRWLDPNLGKGITRVVADGHYLPFNNESIGIIFMCSTYHHMEDKERALDEWYRVLAPNGILVAIGDIYVPLSDRDVLIDIGEYGYTLEEMQTTFRNSAFRAIESFPIQYSENMQYKDAVALTGWAWNNRIIMGVK